MTDVNCLQIFEKLKSAPDAAAQKVHDEAYTARLHAQFEAQQRRIETLVSCCFVDDSYSALICRLTAQLQHYPSCYHLGDQTPKRTAYS